MLFRSSGSLCSSSSQGSASNGSPFEVNHVPTFSAISNTSGSITTGNDVIFTTTASDSDIDGTTDTVTLYVCKSNDFTGTACGAGGVWCSSSASASNPTCSYTIQQGDGDSSHNYYGYIIDNHSFASASNPRSGTFTSDVIASVGGGGGGSGGNGESSEESPIEKSHSECNTQKQCVVISGPGSNQCQINNYSDNSISCNILRYICSYINCTSIGLDLSKCQENASCSVADTTNITDTIDYGGGSSSYIINQQTQQQEFHTECNSEKQCIPVRGLGLNQCQTDTDCDVIPAPVSAPDSTFVPTAPFTIPAPITFPIPIPIPIPIPTSTSAPTPTTAMPNIITDSIETLSQSLNTVGNKINSIIIELIRTPLGLFIVKIISTIGVVIAITAVAKSLFASPISFLEIFLIPTRILSLLTFTFDIKKRNKPWGTVYDSVTKQPIDPAYIVLKDFRNRDVSSAITDIDGRYGFLVQPGKYKITVRKTNYAFPSKKLAVKKKDELYNNLYFGEDIEIEDKTEVIAKNIPLDALRFDWNQFAKRDMNLMRFYSNYDLIMRKISNAFFVVGFIVAIIAFIAAPYLYNTVILGLYILLSTFAALGIKPKSVGYVLDKITGVPLSFAIIRIILSDNNMEIGHRIADKYGRYYCLVPKDRYYVKIESKNNDGSYSSVYTSPIIDASKNGIIKKIFKV